MQPVRLLALICVVAVSSSAPAEPAAGTEAEPAAYEPWSGPGPYRRADTALRRVAPALPLVAPPENGRRPFELTLGLGLGLPRCSEGSVENERCALLGSGLGGDLIGLYRATPYFAFGADLALNRFGPGDPGARAVFFGVLGRVYFLGDGVVDPHLELALGAGSLGTGAVRSALSGSYEQTASGPAARVGAGIDFWMGTRLRFGPALDLTTYLVDTVRRCRAGGCIERSLGSYAHPTSFASLSARLSIAFGTPM